MEFGRWKHRTEYNKQYTPDTVAEIKVHTEAYI